LLFVLQKGALQGKLQKSGYDFLTNKLHQSLTNISYGDKAPLLQNKRQAHPVFYINALIKNTMNNTQHTNHLINSTSPYLLQHAHNPVDWHPWNDETLTKAREQDKLMLVSIGYSACHWCHVMAHECFEDEETARIMNEHFICIKVDREERPDVDHFFITAVQLMGAQGGWPLNVVTLPDGQPFWGGTYFPKDQWKEILLKINNLFQSDREKLTHHAHRLTTGIQQSSLISPEQTEAPDLSEVINEAIERWSAQWDLKLGGSQGKPKFPMPVNLEFLLHLHFHHPQKIFSDFLNTTLQQMARGGIYDQAGGGFARYSVDEFWKVPHFEKMLYDNAQLIELYSHAYAHFGMEEYRDVVKETIAFAENELMHPSGAFYSALDADSEGEEGKFYVWTEEELVDIIGRDFPLFADYFNVNATGLWENGDYILLRTASDEEFAQKHKMTLEEVKKKVSAWKKDLVNHRKNRIRPGLDDKTITSWNALMTKGLAEAYKALGDNRFRQLALKNGEFISRSLISGNGNLFRTWKDGRASVTGFMEDYASVISAFIGLYEITGDEKWIEQSISLADYAEKAFYDEATGQFHYMEKNQTELPANHFDTQDNVIPSANAMMGHALFKLAALTRNQHHRETAENMLKQMLLQFKDYPWGFAHWGSLMLMVHKSSFEVVVAGSEAGQALQQLQKQYRPNVIWAPLKPESPGKLSITENRKSNDEITIYVCAQGACQLPVHSVEEAQHLLD
jgi:hypothetical protein